MNYIEKFAGLVLVVPLAGIACGKPEALDPETDKLGRATGPVDPQAARPPQGMPMQMPMQSPPAPTGPATIHEGEVVEVLHVTRYTYLKLKKGSGDVVWTAVPKTEMETGRRVAVAESLVMKDFTSPTLNRSFDSIVFGVLEEGEGGEQGRADGGAKEREALPAGHPPI